MFFQNEKRSKKINIKSSLMGLGKRMLLSHFPFANVTVDDLVEKLLSMEAMRLGYLSLDDMTRSMAISHQQIEQEAFHAEEIPQEEEQSTLPLDDTNISEVELD